VLSLDLERCMAKEQEAKEVLRAVGNLPDRGPGDSVQVKAAERLVQELGEHASTMQVCVCLAGLISCFI
jgi:hypothetical protein